MDGDIWLTVTSLPLNCPVSTWFMYKIAICMCVCNLFLNKLHTHIHTHIHIKNLLGKNHMNTDRTLPIQPDKILCRRELIMGTKIDILKCHPKICNMVTAFHKLLNQF